MNLGSSRHRYIYYTVPYTGNLVEVTEGHKKNTLTLVKRIVEGSEQYGYSLKGTNISMDRYYTFTTLAEWLYNKKQRKRFEERLRNVFLLQTTNPAHSVTQDDKKNKKTSLRYNIYDCTKAEIDIPD